MTGIAEMFAEFADYERATDFTVAAQCELFGWQRRKAHRERQRVRRALMARQQRDELNAKRRDYYREYRRQQRLANPAIVARDRELSRQRAARRRAERSAA